MSSFVSPKIFRLDYAKDVKIFLDDLGMKTIGDFKEKINRNIITSKVYKEGSYGSYGSYGKDKFGKKLHFISRNDNMNSQKVLMYSQLFKNISNIVLDSLNPHFLIHYGICKGSGGDVIFLEESYDGTLTNFVKSSPSDTVVKNMLAQIIFSILSFHHLGYRKDLSDLDTFSYVKTKPGGYLHYEIFGKDYYLENDGYIWLFSSFDDIEEIPSSNKQKFEYDDEEEFEDEYTNFIYFFRKLSESSDIVSLVDEIDEFKHDNDENDFIKKLLKETDLFLTKDQLKGNPQILNSIPYIIFEDKLTYRNNNIRKHIKKLQIDSAYVLNDVLATDLINKIRSFMV